MTRRSMMRRRGCGASRRAWPRCSCCRARWRRAIVERRWPTRRWTAIGRRSEALLKSGADVNAAQGDGMTALHWAAMNERRGAGDAAARGGRQRQGHDAARRVRRRCCSPPRTAAMPWSTRCSRPAPTSTRVDASRHHAADARCRRRPCRRGESAARCRRRRERDEKAMGQTALMFAAASNRVDAMKTLLAAGADVRVTNKVVDVSSLTDPLEFRPRAAVPPAGAAALAPRRSAATTGTAPARPAPRRRRCPASSASSATTSSSARRAA